MFFRPTFWRRFYKKLLAETFNFSEFCSAKRAVRLGYLIAQIFTAAKTSLSIDDLQEKLPYVPSEKILEVLSDAKKYLPTSAGKFIPFSKIQFDMDEINAAKKQTSPYIDKVGYAITEDYSLSSNFALNHEVAEKDMRNIIYEKFFSEDFARRGKKLSRKVDAVKRISTESEVVKIRSAKGATNQLREFISEQNELPIKRLFAFSETKGYIHYIDGRSWTDGSR